jgi:hypothetical protein
MTKRRTTQGEREAVVWIEHERAVIIERQPDRKPGGTEAVELVDRLPAESEASFDTRAIGQIGERDRVIVTGSAYARVDFERAYVTATHRPDRLVDVEPTSPVIATKG